MTTECFWGYRIISTLIFTVVAVVSLAIAPLDALAQTQSWDGRWALNKKQSIAPDVSFIISMSADGQYRFDLGYSAFTFRCDRNRYPIDKALFIRCTKATKLGMDTVVEDEDGNTITSHREVVENGQVLSQTTTRSRRGTLTKDTKRFRRATKGAGLIGVWKDEDGFRGTPTLLETTLTASHLRLTYPNEKIELVLPLDGTATPIPNDRGQTISASVESAQRISTIKRANGILFNVGAMTLSNDASTLSVESWRPGAPTIKRIMIYKRQ